MSKTSIVLIILFALLGSMILNNAGISYNKGLEIESLKSQLNDSAEKGVAQELEIKRLGSEIEQKNTQLEDMKAWTSDNRPINITIKDQVVYLNRTYAVMMFEPEQYPDRLGYTRLDYTIHLRNGMTLYEYYEVCTHEKAHNEFAWRNETLAKEAENIFDRECFYWAEYLFEKMMELR